jgi:hypothetical protein
MVLSVSLPAGAIRFLRKFQTCPLCRVGISSPNNLPQGFNSGSRSNIILRMPIKGMDKNMPGIPHTALPNKTMMIEMSAFIFTLEETMKGTRK